MKLWQNDELFEFRGGFQVDPTPIIQSAMQADLEVRKLAASKTTTHDSPSGKTPSQASNLELPDIAIQSNAPLTEKQTNGLLRINSGFYLVRSGPRSEKAFAAIVDHARRSELSEQPSFYSTLCGAGGSFREGWSVCWEPKLKIRTIFLNREIFPNGAMKIQGVTATSR